jgi:hypothetical protein
LTLASDIIAAPPIFRSSYQDSPVCDGRDYFESGLSDKELSETASPIRAFDSVTIGGSSPPSADRAKLSLGVIIGVALGTLVLLAVIVLIICLEMKSAQARTVSSLEVRRQA